jgi:hypothetical protein
MPIFKLLFLKEVYFYQFFLGNFLLKLGHLLLAGPFFAQEKMI